MQDKRQMAKVQLREHAYSEMMDKPPNSNLSLDSY